MSVFNNQAVPGSPAPEQRPVRSPSQPFATSQAAASQQASQAAEAPKKVSVLGKTLVFKGELSADEDIVLQGRVEGAIHHTQSVTVGIDGVVIGDTHARSILVEGTVEGDLRGVVSVLIAATATVRGNISAPRVGIMEGANFNGSVDMGSNMAAGRGTDGHFRAESLTADTGLTERSVDKILSK
jgi:cytoskeletal protein CcmA (bactofilin family)